MFRTIVAGCNGRERGLGAAALAQALATATGARLLLVGVYHNPPLPYPEGYAAIHEQLEQDLRRVRDEFAPGALVETVADLAPAHALRQIAAREHADLLVVGSRHRRRLQRIVEADQAMHVLHGAPCAVAVAPDPIPPRPELRRIGVGIDATPESALALVMARDLAQRTGARLWLQAVADDMAPPWLGLPIGAIYADAREGIVDRRADEARELLETRLESCGDVPAEGAATIGDPAGELILASERLDLLVLGSRRWGPVRRLWLGSTSERVIRHAACPVLVPPRGAEADSQADGEATDEAALS